MSLNHSNLEDMLFLFYRIDKKPCSSARYINAAARFRIQADRLLKSECSPSHFIYRTTFLGSGATSEIYKSNDMQDFKSHIEQILEGKTPSATSSSNQEF